MFEIIVHERILNMTSENWNNCTSSTQPLYYKFVYFCSFQLSSTMVVVVIIPSSIIFDTISPKLLIRPADRCRCDRFAFTTHVNPTPTTSNNNNVRLSWNGLGFWCVHHFPCIATVRPFIQLVCTDTNTLFNWQIIYWAALDNLHLYNLWLNHVQLWI